MKSMMRRAGGTGPVLLCLAALTASVSGCALVLGYDGMAFTDEDGGGATSAQPPDHGGTLTDECIPYTCEEQGAQCGAVDNGCGGVTLCGQCPGGQSCGAQEANRCGDGDCSPATCASLGTDCATVSDGCGGMLDCGTCEPPLVCGGGGVANVCGCQGADCQPPCVPATCTSAGAECGSIDDGCGGTLQCGGCNGDGEQCGAGGVPNQCASAEHHELVSKPGGGSGDPGGMIPVCCAPSPQEKKFIQRVFELLNEHRQKHGRSPLQYDDKLEHAIEGHCHHMATHGFFSHSAPEQVVRDPWKRAAACGTTASGENIAVGQQSPEEVMNTWRWSPGHNANMLGNFSRVGIGFHAGGEWGTYWGQIFD